jgi:hypothetical protein
VAGWSSLQLGVGETTESRFNDDRVYIKITHDIFSIWRLGRCKHVARSTQDQQVPGPRRYYLVGSIIMTLHHDGRSPPREVRRQGALRAGTEHVGRDHVGLVARSTQDQRAPGCVPVQQGHQGPAQAQGHHRRRHQDRVRMPALFSRKDDVRRLLRRVQTSAVQLHPPRPGAGCGTARTLNHGLHYTASLCWAWHGAAPEGSSKE